MVYIVMRAQISIASKEFVYPTKAVSVAGCTYEFANVTMAVNADFDNINKSIHHVSFLYYTLIGATITSLSGYFHSFFLGTNDLSIMNPSLIAPFLKDYIFPKQMSNRTSVVHSFENSDTKL